MVGSDVKVSASAKKMSVDLKNARHLEGLSSSELAMILRLAGNDTEVRKKTIRKLKKWLTALAKRVPNTAESREMIEPNFIRVWKALFYCMWMADKPLPQELLAEQISSLVSLFASKPKVLILFVEWFFITFAREWAWIDRLRLDKFMMLIRRFLRKTMEAFVQHHWSDEIVDPFLKILTVHLFNRHPPAPKTRAKAKTPDPVKSPLGLQIHITDILLEELAKVGAGTLETSHIIKMISPFISELRENDDERLLSQIKQRIFHHLMKQSDVGIDYVESRGGRLVRVEDEDKDAEEQDEESGEDEQGPTNGGPLDPRAGAVDVVLPQLELDYEELIQKLVEAGGQKGTRSKNRKLLYGLAREFHSLVKGEFPLAIPIEGTRIPAIPRREIQNAAKRLIEMEEGMVETTRSKKRKNKKSEDSLHHYSEASNDSIGSEDNSMYLNDSELLDHVGDNYMSYLVEMDKDEDEDETPEDKSPKKVKSPKIADKKSPKSKSLKKASADVEVNTENCEDDDSSPKESQDTYVVIKRKRRLSNGVNSKPKNGDIKKRKTVTLSPKEPVNEVSSSTPSPSTSPGKRSSPRELSASPSPKKIIATNNSAVEMNGSSKPKKVSLSKKKQESPTKGTPSPPRIGKRNGINITPETTLPATPSSSSAIKKRVNFVLAKNLEHPHADYKDSIERSPAIPFDSKRRPSIGLLKSPASKIINGTPAGIGRLAGTPRRPKAADFFQ